MPKAGFIVARVSFLVLAASMLGSAMLAAPAAGQTSTCSTSKCFFAVAVSPSNPAAGTNTSFAFTIENEASSQQLGAVRISAPTGLGFVITGASVAPGAPGTASFTSSSALFTNLSVAPGSTVTLTVNATLPCGSGSYQWGIAAKQSNNFNGSGNDFQLDPRSQNNLSGTATGSCTQSPPCQSQTCSASASSGTTGDSVTVTTSGPVPKTDFVVAGIEDSIENPSFNYNCPTYTSSRDVFSFGVFDANGAPQSKVTLTVTVRIDKSVVSMSDHPGASSWQICYASTTPFNLNAVSGTYTPAMPSPPGQTIGGIPYNTGLLLGCSATDRTPPCVQSRNKNNAGDVIVTFLASGDPFGHP